MGMDGIHVVLANDHPIMGTGAHILEESRHLFEDLAPDILLLEMTLAEEQVLPPEGAESMPATPRVFVLRGHHNRTYVFGLLTSASDAVLTEQEALRLIADAIKARLAGETAGLSHRIVANLPPRRLEGAHATMPDLTARETDVLRQLTTGKSDQMIGEQLGISKRTVRYHLENIYAKLGVKHRGGAIVWAVQAGLGE
jgi:DNA-binding NarL/FixJ family response regulator